MNLISSKTTIILQGPHTLYMYTCTCMTVRIVVCMTVCIVVVWISSWSVKSRAQSNHFHSLWTSQQTQVNNKYMSIGILYIIERLSSIRGKNVFPLYSVLYTEVSFIQRCPLYRGVLYTEVSFIQSVLYQSIYFHTGPHSHTANHKPDEFCHVTCPTPDAINTLLPIGKNEKRNFLVEIVAKFPTYYRVKNDFVSTLSRQQPYAEHGASMPLPEEPIPQKIPFKRKGSPATKRSPPRNSPDGSPVGKQPPEKLKDLTKHPHHLHMLDQPLSAPAVVGTPKLMDSLNIDFPKVSKVTSSLQTSTVPSSLIHGMSPIVSKRGIPNLSRVGSTKSSRKHYDEWDFNQFMDKRASIRSDPGECKREGGGIFSRSPRGSGISTPLQKSPSRSGSLFDDTEFSPLKTGKEGGIFTFNNQNSSPRLSVGSLSSQKSPSRTPHRKGATAIKKNVISLPSDLRHNTPSILPTEVPVLASFTLHYSGGEGRKAGYHRRMESSVKVKVCPSLYFDDFHISSVIRYI